MLSSVKPEFVLARFAWGIFPLVKAFIEHGPPRLVKVREKTGNVAHEVMKPITPAQFIALGNSQVKNDTPKKRKASAIPSQDQSKLKRHRRNPTRISLPSLTTEIEETQESFSQGSEASQSENSATPSENEMEYDESLIAELGLHELGPTHDSALICSDYILTNEYMFEGLQGPAEFSGGNLCMNEFYSAEFEFGLNL